MISENVFTFQNPTKKNFTFLFTLSEKFWPSQPMEYIFLQGPRLWVGKAVFDVNSKNISNRSAIETKAVTGFGFGLKTSTKTESHKPKPIELFSNILQPKRVTQTEKNSFFFATETEICRLQPKPIWNIFATETNWKYFCSRNRLKIFCNRNRKSLDTGQKHKKFFRVALLGKDKLVATYFSTMTETKLHIL